MKDLENKKSNENEKRTAKPKKAKEMEIITTVRKISKAVKCNSVLKSYLIFQDILNYEEDALKDHEHFRFAHRVG